MIHSISIENFYSIADRQEISFAVLRNAPELPCFRHSLSSKAIRIPTALGLFGPNASGKSTVLRAIISSIVFACKSFEWDGAGLGFQAYREKEWMKKPTKFSMDFDASLDGKTVFLFRYELHIAHLGFANKEVAYEALSYSPNGRFRILFERHGSEFKFGKEFDIASKTDPRVASIRSDVAVLSTLKQFNHPLASTLWHQLLTMQSVGFHYAENILELYARDKNLSNSLNKLLIKLDIGIESISIERGPTGLFARFKHAGLDDYIVMEEESVGTQRFISVFPKLYYALQTGSIVLVDELDIHFHALLFPEILDWFSSVETNSKNAQLLFTAQNPILLDDLEKEQVYFTEKQTGNSTIVYGARDIEGLRRTPSLMKKYLSGELGAVPHIG